MKNNNKIQNNFLNIQCRDAMNLSEFLEQIQITFQDLLYLGNHGFVESFKDTFIKQLKTLDQTKRRLPSPAPKMGCDREAKRSRAPVLLRP